MALGEYDSWLLLSFGGPEGPDDVIPFLENVTRGRAIPPERLRSVAMQYDQFGGRSPINDQNRALRAAIDAELQRRGHQLEGAWGNRNWHPYLSEAVADLTQRGCQATLCVTTSAFSSYSGCRQYHDDLAQVVAQTPSAPTIRRVRVFWNHPDYLGAVADQLRTARDQAGWSNDVAVLFSAHSIPLSQSATCDYVAQLEEAVELTAALADASGPAELVFQSRSGPPSMPWLEPDISQRLRQLALEDIQQVLVVPIGFVSDHMEVQYDLDTLAGATADEIGITMVRVPTVGTHPRFVAMLVDLMEEAAGLRSDRPFLGRQGPRPDDCAAGCCPAPARPQPAARN